MNKEYIITAYDKGKMLRTTISQPMSLKRARANRAMLDAEIWLMKGKHNLSEPKVELFNNTSQS
jgi:hypothetical protein